MQQLRFPAHGGFHETIKKRVAQYFVDSGKSSSGDWRLFVKTAVILGWLLGSYLLLVFFSSSLLVTILAVFALAQGFALAGFNIMHDGAHGSYARRPLINRIMGGMLNVMGGSQKLWRHKHNRLHHIYTNIHAVDDDIETHGLLRFSPEQAWRPWHRFQHVYAFALYSLLTLSWVTVGDVRKIIAGRIGHAVFPRSSITDLGVFCCAKLCYFGYAFILPCFFHPWQHVLLAFVGVHLILGVTLATVFQLAHTVKHTRFPTPEAHTGRMPTSWAVHQVETTADFAPHNPWVTWYLGGLNFQIEHHLFARISHVHYPAIRPLVADTCRAFGVLYICYPTVWSALVAHYQFLQTMGRRPHTALLAAHDTSTPALMPSSLAQP